MLGYFEGTLQGFRTCNGSVEVRAEASVVEILPKHDQGKVLIEIDGS